MTPDDEDEDDDDGRHDASTMHRRVCSHLERVAAVAGVSSRGSVYGSERRRDARDAHGVTAALPRHGALSRAPATRYSEVAAFTRCARILTARTGSRSALLSE